MAFGIKAAVSLCALLTLVVAKEPRVGEIGTIDLPEISGAVQLGDAVDSPLLLVGDEDDHISLLSKPFAAFSELNVKTGFRDLAVEAHLRDASGEARINDMEDVAWDAVGRTAYITTSNSYNSKGKRSKKRTLIAAIPFDANNNPKPEDDPTTLQLATLLGATLPTSSPLRKAFDLKSPGVGGQNGALNIEGLAFDPTSKELVVGFRSPTAPGDKSYILRIKNPEAIKSKVDALESSIQELELGTGRGIRGMTFDRVNKVFWIIAGNSSDTASSVGDAWALYAWKHDSAPVEIDQAKIRQVVTAYLSEEGYEKSLWWPEAVTVLAGDPNPMLLLIGDAGDVNGKAGPSPYVLLPLKELFAKAGL